MINLIYSNSINIKLKKYLSIHLRIVLFFLNPFLEVKLDVLACDLQHVQLLGL